VADTFRAMLRARKPRQRPTARDRQREETRKRLLDAARKLFAKNGYEGVSVTDIGKEAGVSHAMIYANFGDKAGLLYEIIKENNAPQYPAAVCAAKSSGSALERIIKVLGVWAKYDLSDPELLAIMQGYSWTWPAEFERVNSRERAKHLKLVEDLIAEGIEQAEFSDRLDAAIASDAIFAIYTWGLRPGVFEGASAAACIQRLEPQIRLLVEQAHEV
jgi:AcrR family transcriptional regulator